MVVSFDFTHSGYPLVLENQNVNVKNLKVATLVLSEAVLLGGVGALLDECQKLKTK